MLAEAVASCVVSGDAVPDEDLSCGWTESDFIGPDSLVGECSGANGQRDLVRVHCVVPCVVPRWGE